MISPAVLHHITTHEAWDAASATGAYAPESLATEGFIHLSAPEQVLGTANRFYRGAEGLVVLSIDAASVKGDVRWEEGEPGVLFPHLYRALRTAEVVGAAELIADDGAWTGLA